MKEVIFIQSKYIMPGDGKLSDRVYMALKEAIIKMKIKPRELITIGELTKVFNVSRTPVRDALLRLERENWVTVLPNKGAYVNSASAKEISDIIEMQVLLEGYMVERAAVYITSQQIKEATKILDKSEKCILSGDLEAFAKCGSDFHMIIADAASNDKLKRYVKELAEEFERVEPFIRYSTTVSLEKTLSQHRKILQSIINKDGVSARVQMQDHMSWFKESLLEDLTKYERRLIF